MRFCRVAFIVGLAGTLTACSSTYIVTCRDGDHLAIHDSLYFGTAKPNGVVTPEDWAEFLATQSYPAVSPGPYIIARLGTVARPRR
jgi:hypothetical protein